MSQELVFNRKLAMVAGVQALSAMVALTGRLIEASSPAVFGRFALGFAYFLLLVASLGFVFSGAVLAGQARRLGKTAKTAGLGFIVGAGLASLGFMLEMIAVAANSANAFKAGLLIIYFAAPLLVAAEALTGLIFLGEADRARSRIAWGASILYIVAPILGVFMNGVGWILAAIIATIIIYVEVRGVPEAEKLVGSVSKQLERITGPEEESKKE